MVRKAEMRFQTNQTTILVTVGRRGENMDGYGVGSIISHVK